MMGDRSCTGQFDTATLIVIITSALSLYNSLELVLLIFTTFTSYRGLYFWSLLIATTGLIPYSVGLILSYFLVANTAVTAFALAINNYGWWATITGQSVVLYSRLGVVLGKGNERILKNVKWMIIIDAILFHITTTVVFFGASYASPPARAPLSRAFNYVEKIQMTGFCIQEFIISGLYLWKTMDIVKSQADPVRSNSTASGQRNKPHVRRLMWQLFIINVIIVVMDIALLVIEYKNLHIPEIAFKGLCYSVKLKLEFAVLNAFATTVDDKTVHKTESLPHMTGTSDFAIDTSRKRATAKVMHSFGSQSSTEPEWLEDLEKTRSRRVNTLHAGSNTDAEKLPQGDLLHSDRKSSEIPTFNSISVSEPPKHRRVRRDPDLLYADAIREMAKI